MNGTKIIADDIFGSKNININTPIIILHNVTHEYLLPVGNGIYNVDTDKLQNDLEHHIQFIDRFVPLGQIQLRSKSGRNKNKNKNNYQQTFTLPMANTRIIHVTNTFEEIDRNVWIGIISKAGKESRTIGTIKSKGSPKTMYPVFPSTFLNKKPTYDEGNDDLDIYANIYSDDVYGQWTLNMYKFNVDKTHLKMIDSAGEMNNMYIPKPITPKDVLDVGYGDDDYNRKVYFTTQGLIVSNSDCIPSLDNMSKMTINECNGATIYDKNVANSIRANDDDDQLSLMLNEEVDFNNAFDTKNKKKIFSREKKLVLREKDEPWFTDANVVGTAASISNSHKITGIMDGKTTLPLMSRDTIISRNDLVNASNLGTIDGNQKETQASFISDCKTANPIGYSRYEQNQNCNKGDIEHFSDSNNNLDYINNYIIYAMCIIIIILLLYRRK